MTDETMNDYHKQSQSQDSQKYTKRPIQEQHAYNAQQEQSYGQKQERAPEMAPWRRPYRTRQYQYPPCQYYHAQPPRYYDDPRRIRYQEIEGPKQRTHPRWQMQMPRQNIGPRGYPRQRPCYPYHQGAPYYQGQMHPQRTRSRRMHVAAKKNKVLGIFGLNPQTTEDDIASFIASFGKNVTIEQVMLVRDKETSASKRFAFVYFKDEDQAEIIKKQINGTVFMGSELRVDYSITSKPHLTQGEGKEHKYEMDEQYGKQQEQENFYSEKYIQEEKKELKEEMRFNLF